MSSIFMIHLEGEPGGLERVRKPNWVLFAGSESLYGYILLVAKAREYEQNGLELTAVVNSLNSEKDTSPPGTCVTTKIRHKQSQKLVEEVGQAAQQRQPTIVRAGAEYSNMIIVTLRVRGLRPSLFYNP
ncbi:MAG: hypothetical protein FWG14_12360 [Peptococcaceae bacterium]|nr:hypothetical protein [Peptococcaceae bacterium]